jgi:uncharacterized protein (DUF342 family)
MLFKSKYRTRIDRKLADLEAEIEQIKAGKAKIKKTLNPSEYCKLIVAEGNVMDKILLLKSLL